MQTQAVQQTIQLLPLLLQHGKAIELPIVIVGCRKIVLHDLVYKNKSSADLIKNCTLVVNGEKIRYKKIGTSDKTYYINGEKDGTFEVKLNPLNDIRFNFEVTCGNFEVCSCKEHRFQLNISAVYE